MAVTLSATVLLLIVLLVMVRTGALRLGGAIAASLFGFFLASTGLAPTITQFLQNAASVIDHIHL